jgi:hypothetical protein
MLLQAPMKMCIAGKNQPRWLAGRNNVPIEPKPAGYHRGWGSFRVPRKQADARRWIRSHWRSGGRPHWRFLSAIGCCRDLVFISAQAWLTPACPKVDANSCFSLNFGGFDVAEWYCQLMPNRSAKDTRMTSATHTQSRSCLAAVGALRSGKDRRSVAASCPLKRYLYG